MRLTDRLSILFVGFFISLVCMLSAFFYPQLVVRLGDWATDKQLWLEQSEMQAPLPIIIEIDEKSLAAMGQWPWPRYQLARLLKELESAGVKAVGVNVIFPELDRTSPAQIQQALKTDFNTNLPLEALKPALDFDHILAQQLQHGPFVLAYYFTFAQKTGSGTCMPHASSVVLLNEEAYSKFYHKTYTATGILCSNPTLSNATHYSGFYNAKIDDDQIYRKAPLIVEWKGRLYPSFALQTYFAANDIKQFSVVTRDDGYAINFANRSIPIDGSGSLRVRWPRDPQRYERISAIDVLQKHVDVNQLRGKIALIGFAAVGLEDTQLMTGHTVSSGVELHAAVIDNIAQGDFLFQSTLSHYFEATLAFAAGIFITIILAFSGLTLSIVAPIMLFIALGVISQTVLVMYGYVISPIWSWFCIALVAGVLLLLRYIRTLLRSFVRMHYTQESYEAIIRSICAISEYRDIEKEAHIVRTQCYVKILAKYLREETAFRDQLDDETIKLLPKVAPLHDVGKIAIRDNIVLKPGRLNDAEFETMKTHTLIGAQIVNRALVGISSNRFIELAGEMALSHQEKWDGSGYPEGLRGDQIPLSARIMAVADVYDALISRRVYKPPFSHQKAIEQMSEASGTHFDPAIVEVFLRIHEQFKEVALEHLDDEDQRDGLLGALEI